MALGSQGWFPAASGPGVDGMVPQALHRLRFQAVPKDRALLWGVSLF